ncbi:MAG TPA: phage tail protein [Steroidobacteraceae bacterium]|jgi:hypothetical protein
MRLSARTNVDQVLRDLDDYVKTAVDVAMPRAVNKLADQAETAGLRKISDIYGVGPRTMEQYVTVDRASAKDLRATINAKGKGFPLTLFNPRQSRLGVTVRIKGRTVLIPHAFIARMHNGHVGVFARGAYGARGAQLLTGEMFGRFAFGRSRLPINELYTSSPPDALANPDVLDAMQKRVDEQASKVIGQEIRFAVRSGR